MAELTFAIVACECGLTTEVEIKAATNLARARRAFDAATVAANTVKMSEVEQECFIRRHSLVRARLRELADKLFNLLDDQAELKTRKSLTQELFRFYGEKILNLDYR